MLSLITFDKSNSSMSISEVALNDLRSDCKACRELLNIELYIHKTLGVEFSFSDQVVS